MVMNVPKKVVKGTAGQIKTTVKAAVAPASPGGTAYVFLGALLSPPLASVYSYLYNLTLGRLPIPPIINVLVKIIAPSVPAYFVKKISMPFGNIIAGTLVGISAAQIINLILGLIAGNFKPNGTPMSAEALTIAQPEWLDKLL